MASERATAAAEILFRKRARASLLSFTEYTHPSWKTSHHHVKVCYYLERLEELAACTFCGAPIESLAVFAPRRHGKTELVSRRFPAWCIGRHPDWNIICAQATGLLAFDTGADVRNIIKGDAYKKIFPGVSLQEDAQAAGRWVVSKGGVYFAAGVGGTSVGRGANVLGIDDPHGGREDADSQRMRDIAARWYFGDVLPTLMPPMHKLLTLTRWNQDDLAARILIPERDWLNTEDPQFFCAADWHVLRLRAIENEDQENAYALWPDRYTLAYLYKLRDTMRAAGRGREWEAQYQQNPVVEEGTFLLRTWFDDRYEDMPAGSTPFITTDFAVTSEMKARDPDRTEFVDVYLAPNDHVYIGGSETLTTDSNVWITKLIDRIDDLSPSCVFGEKGVIKNSIWPALSREMETRGTVAYFEWMPTIGDKLARGRAFQAWASSGRVHFPKSAPWVEKFIDELVAVGGGGRYFDKFDALSHFFLAIEDNHPAILRPASVSDRKRDRWERFPHERGDSWKTR